MSLFTKEQILYIDVQLDGTVTLCVPNHSGPFSAKSSDLCSTLKKQRKIGFSFVSFSITAISNFSGGNQFAAFLLQ